MGGSRSAAGRPIVRRYFRPPEETFMLRKLQAALLAATMVTAPALIAGVMYSSPAQAQSEKAQSKSDSGGKSGSQASAKSGDQKGQKSANSSGSQSTAGSRDNGNKTT